MAHGQHKGDVVVFFINTTSADYVKLKFGDKMVPIVYNKFKKIENLYFKGDWYAH